MLQGGGGGGGGAYLRFGGVGEDRKAWGVPLKVSACSKPQKIYFVVLMRAQIQCIKCESVGVLVCVWQKKEKKKPILSQLVKSNEVEPLQQRKAGDLR